MNFLVDENVDIKLVEMLRMKKFNVISILEGYSGISDDKVIELANLHKALIVTEDKDFGELAFRLRMVHSGILLLRLSDIPKQERYPLAFDIISKHYSKMKNRFSVLTKIGLRIK